MIESKKIERITKTKTRFDWPAWPFYSEEEIDTAATVLRSGKVNYWTGDECRLFEKEYSQAVGTKYAVALMNGSVALEAALYALDIGTGDEIITTSRTFIATASAALMRGAKPIFADVDLDSQNITAESIESKITAQTKAIIIVHLAGWPCAMDEILALAKKYRLAIIEDCAQANGALYKGKAVGSFGDVGAFSFCQSKIISTGGEGGMITTDNEELWKKIWAYKDHGKSYDAVYHRNHPPGFRWLCDSFGTNWRMTEVQAAVGRLQLKKLPEWVRIRQRNAAILNAAFASLPMIRLTLPPHYINHAYYHYYAFIKPERLNPGVTRNSLIESINAVGVPCFSGSCSEIYLEEAFSKAHLQPKERLPYARELGETSLTFLVHPTLTESDMQEMAALITDVLMNKCR